MSTCPSARSSAVALIAACAFWGTATVISKGALAKVPPIPFLVAQLAPSVVALWLLVLATGVCAAPRRLLAPIILLGVLNPGLSYTFSMLGLTLTTASATSLMWAAEPAMVLVMARVVLGEAITPALAAIVVAAAGGVMLVAGVLPGGEDSGTILGNSLVLAGVACCGIYTVLSRILVPAADALFIVAVQQTAGLAWAVALLGLDTGAGGVPALLALTGGQWLGASVSGLMYYAAAFWLYLIGLRRFPAGVAAGFLNLIPLFTIAAAFLVLDERLDWRQWLGAAVIVLSMLGLLSRLPRPGAAS